MFCQFCSVFSNSVFQTMTILIVYLHMLVMMDNGDPGLITLSAVDLWLRIFMMLRFRTMLCVLIIGLHVPALYARCCVTQCMWIMMSDTLNYQTGVKQRLIPLCVIRPSWIITSPVLIYLKIFCLAMEPVACLNITIYLMCTIISQPLNAPFWARIMGQTDRQHWLKPLSTGRWSPVDSDDWLLPLGPWPLVVDNVVVTSAHPGHDGVT